ncbi:MAG: VanZ family protein [Clostridia bacterium]|nr:VanZ family protein [Clostridia bacterium]
MKKRIISIILIIATLGWMCFIFSLSAEPAEVSSQTSGRIVKKLCRIIDRDFDELSPEEQFEITEKYQFYIRKTAHFSAYTILAILIGSSAIPYFEKVRYRLGISFVVGVLYAISDEIHQYFVPGRSCELRDVLIDSAGVTLGCILLFILFKIIENKKRSI